MIPILHHHAQPRSQIVTKQPNSIPLRPDYTRAVVPSPSRYFARACFATAQATVLNETADRFIPASDDVTRIIINRAVATPGSTVASGWTAIAQQAFRSYLADLAPYSGAARLIAGATPASLLRGPEISENYPVRVGGRTTMGFVEENQPIPVSAGNFGLVSIGPGKKMAAILAWSRELGKRSDAESIFDTMLREDLAASLDTVFFGTGAATTAAPAGLLNGVTALAGYIGGDREALKLDLTALGVAVAENGTGETVYIMRPERIVRLRLLAPDIADAINIAPSTAIPLDRVIAAEAAALLVAVDPSPDIAVSQNAVVHMSTVPLEIVSHTGPTTADPVRSLWQTVSKAFRVIHEMDFVKRRSNAVAYLDGATW